jgi:formamidopyrimidine-DNA glycosylase
MPELPEVETVMQGLIPFLHHQKIVSITVRSPSLRIPIPKQKLQSLIGVKVDSLVRRAKYILAHFENGKTAIIHLGMTGSFAVYPPAKHKNIILDRHDHIVMVTDKNDKIIFRDPRRFGMVDVIKTDTLSSYKAIEKLGVEPLGDEFNTITLKEKLSSRRIAIKVAIMDQSVVVGVGNIYASEALYLSSIDPTTPANLIDDKKLKILVNNIKKILKAAIESGGSTLRDYRHVGGETGYFQFHFSVYDRVGEACPDCTCSLKKTGGIQRIIQGGRSTFYCATRQK